jgi:2-polyprenyl-3-methyl-5-hydroxy-6-metoxy-1,4-benzoquinol methylase
MSIERKQMLEEAARHYDIPNDFEQVNIQLASRLIRPLCEGKTVLEVGCGSGEMTGELAACSKALTIVEPATSFYRMVRERFQDSVTAYNCFLEDISCPATYDVIVMASLLHHIEDPPAFLGSVRKFCHAGTLVIATVPNVGSLHRQIGVRAGLIRDVHDDSERNLRYRQFGKFDLATLRGLFTEAGFAVEQAFGYMLKPFSSEQMMSLQLDAKIIDALFDMGRDFPELSSQLFLSARIGGAHGGLHESTLS